MGPAEVGIMYRRVGRWTVFVTAGMFWLGVAAFLTRLATVSSQGTKPHMSRNSVAFNWFEDLTISSGQWVSAIGLV
jgi:hypothetical protein